MVPGRTNRPPPQGAQGSHLYQSLGGTAACRKLSTVFYSGVELDPALQPLFPGKTHTCAIEEFAAFLAQFLGGPDEAADRRWWLSLIESHSRFVIGPKERDAWMAKMLRALEETQIEEPARNALRRFFEETSAYIVNHHRESLESVKRANPSDALGLEIAWRWDAQRSLDKAVAAIRRGEAAGAIALADGSALQRYFQENSSVLAALLARMIGSRDSQMRDYARHRLRVVPALAQQRYSGRTLLHAASAAGDAATVELLLGLGADPNITDAGRHTPLYCVGNECKVKEGASVVRLLVRAGATVDAQDGVKRCTPLHMAARRGSVAVAEALLDCGANLEARDSLGDTPLRRAVNCDQLEVAALLIARGADPRSKGSKKITPLQAARSLAMQAVLQSGGPQ